MERSNGAIRTDNAGAASFSLPTITVLVGHAGTGKTNTALGFALAEAERGHDVTLADLDVVNPYFRSSDYADLLADAGVRLIAPVLAGTTLDTPSLTGELDAVIGQVAADPNKRLILDVGGDDDGATTIGRWARQLQEAGLVELGSREAMVAFCKGIQAAAPVDSYVDPIPWAMPGYDDEVIMAAGAFVQGSSIELSADGPIRPPYAVYFQGGLTWYHAKLGILMSLQKLTEAGIIKLS